jgi:hypothetical protein
MLRDIWNSVCHNIENSFENHPVSYPLCVEESVANLTTILHLRKHHIQVGSKLYKYVTGFSYFFPIFFNCFTMEYAFMSP